MQYRGSTLRPKKSKVVILAQPIQNRGSNAFMVSRLSAAKIAGATRAAMAARPWAKRFPPSSRASRAARATSAAPATAGKNRIAGRESPSRERAGQVIAAISGGWST